MNGGLTHKIVIVDANRDSCVPDRQHLGRRNFVNHMHMTLRAMPFEYQLLNTTLQIREIYREYNERMAKKLEDG